VDSVAAAPKTVDPTGWAYVEVKLCTEIEVAPKAATAAAVTVWMVEPEPIVMSSPLAIAADSDVTAREVTPL
jgi:hypothetical protein